MSHRNRRDEDDPASMDDDAARKLTAIMSPFRPAGSKIPAATQEQPSSSQTKETPLKRAIAAYRASHPDQSLPPQLMIARTSVSLARLDSESSSSRSPSRSRMVSPRVDLDVLVTSTKRNDEFSRSRGVPTKKRSASPVSGLLDDSSTARQPPHETVQRHRSPSPRSANNSPTRYRAAQVAQVNRTMMSESKNTATPSDASVVAVESTSSSAQQHAHRDPYFEETYKEREAERNAAARVVELKYEVKSLQDTNERLTAKLTATEHSLKQCSAELEDTRHELFAAGAQQQQSAKTVEELTAAFEEVKAMSLESVSVHKVEMAKVVEERDAAVEELLTAHKEMERLRRAVHELSIR